MCIKISINCSNVKWQLLHITTISSLVTYYAIQMKFSDCFKFLWEELFSKFILYVMMGELLASLLKCVSNGRIRSIRPEVFCRKGVLRNFAKQILAQVLSCEFCEISKSNYFYKTPPVAASSESFIPISFRKWVKLSSPCVPCIAIPCLANYLREFATAIR